MGGFVDYRGLGDPAYPGAEAGRVNPGDRTLA